MSNLEKMDLFQRLYFFLYNRSKIDYNTSILSKGER